MKVRHQLQQLLQETGERQKVIGPARGTIIGLWTQETLPVKFFEGVM